MLRSNSSGDLAPTSRDVMPGLDLSQAREILAGCSSSSFANEMMSEIALKVSFSIPFSPCAASGRFPLNKRERDKPSGTLSGEEYRPVSSP